MIGCIDEHGVVKDEGYIISYLCYDECDEKALPGFEEGKEEGCEDGEDDGGEETFSASDGAVCESSEKGTGYGGDEGRGGHGHTPVGKVFGAGNAASFCKALKINGEDGGNQQNKSGIAHIVEHPVPFFRGKQF